MLQNYYFKLLFKAILPSDGIGLINLWIKYKFNEQTKYVYGVVDAMKKLK